MNFIEPVKFENITGTKRAKFFKEYRIPGKISGTALFAPSLSSLGRRASACSTLEKSREGESVKKNGPDRAESVSGSYSNFFDQ